ncbi:MAG: DUF167 domain-containing protein [Candidatus Woesearchaeota archaeon]|nr:MAG: DUF167 domain-containing protein [Candidatus Woesearchaeota archaeon]
MEKEVIVKVNQPKTKILKEDSKTITVALKSKPLEGRANKELINFLSKKYSSEIKILRGIKNRKKLVKLIPRH